MCRNYRSVMRPVEAATHTASQQKSKEACETLRAALPSYDTIVPTLTGPCAAWWRAYHHKTVKASQVFRDSLPEFARHAYTSNNPAKLGQLVVAYARCSGKNHRLYSLVEHLIISDPEFSTTNEGLECLLLLAKVYTDNGQPRRSWFMYRRGVAIAQLIVSESLWQRSATLLLIQTQGFISQRFKLTTAREDLVGIISWGSVYKSASWSPVRLL